MVKETSERAETFWLRWRSPVMLLLVGFMAGFLWLAGLRFFLVQTSETHYHANFAVYLNGNREAFDNFTYYEEVAACSDGASPKGRVHMHGQVNDVIHVHDQRVTYGNFFENIGWAISAHSISSRDKTYVEDSVNKVRYILNGEEVDNVANRIIGDTDRLLVSFGPADADVNGLFANVPQTAAEVNTRPDPASCGGLSGYDEGFLSRLKRASFWE